MVPSRVRITLVSTYRSSILTMQLSNHRGGSMSVAYDASPTEMVESLERSILDYLQDRKSAPAEEVVRAIQSQNHYITTEPIVTAVWSLNAQGRIRVGGDWTITLREAKSSATET